MRHFEYDVGDVPHHPHRIRPRLSLWLRVLHRDGLLRRLDPLPHQPEHRRRDAAAEGARRAARSGKIAVFFVDDNFAINVKRTKSLLRDIIAAGAQLSWVGQISANLLRDEELVDLIADSGGKWIFIGMESLDPANLASVNKSFNKPGGVRGACSSGWRGATSTRSRRSSSDWTTIRRASPSARWTQMRDWPPVLPVFGQITPFPATPLYDRLEKEGRLTRPKHWLEFAPFQMAHTPLKMTDPGSAGRSPLRLAELLQPGGDGNGRSNRSRTNRCRTRSATWSRASSSAESISRRRAWGWLKVIAQNRGSIFRIVRESFTQWHGTNKAGLRAFNGGPACTPLTADVPTDTGPS